MKEERLCNLLEIVRWTAVGLGFFLAFDPRRGPAAQLDVLCFWLVVPLAGLTGLESLFLGKAASGQSGYGSGSAYQRQSGFNNLALALAALLTYLLGWGLHAKASLLVALLIFLFLSGANHAWSALKEGNRSLKNLLRPLMSLLLILMTVPFLLRAL